MTGRLAYRASSLVVVVVIHEANVRSASASRLYCANRLYSEPQTPSDPTEPVPERLPDHEQHPRPRREREGLALPPHCLARAASIKGVSVCVHIPSLFLLKIVVSV